MLIWFAMIVPVITAGILYVWFEHKTLWWEFLIPLGVSAVLIFVCKLGTQASQTHDTEYWGGWISHAEHYEAWDERVSCRHPKYETRTRTVTRSDANGRSYTTTESYQEFVGYQHLYDVDYHPEYREVTDSNGITKKVSSGTFESIVATFRNRRKVDLHRDYHSIDGDKFVTTWPGDDNTLLPFTSVHSYTNRVQATHTIIAFKEVDPEEFGLYEYPKITNHYHCPSILGDGGPTTEAAERLISLTNAKLGKSKQMRIWVLIFKNKPLDAGFDQQHYWKGGNKNEFVLTIGVDDAYNVQWCHPFSWTEEEKLKVDARNFVIDQKGKELDLVSIAHWLHQEGNERFVRKEFADFDYLTIEPPWWGYLLTYVLTITVNIGLSMYIVSNEHKEERRTDPSFHLYD